MPALRDVSVAIMTNERTSTLLSIEHGRAPFARCPKMLLANCPAPELLLILLMALTLPSQTLILTVFGTHILAGQKVAEAQQWAMGCGGLSM